MSEFARLQEKLGKLRQVEPRSSVGRVLRGSNAALRLSALVSEFDETILSRKLTISDGAKNLSFIVANRQLQAIVGTLDSGDDNTVHVVASREDDRLDSLKSELLAAFSDGSWHIRTTKPTREEVAQTPPNAGVAARILGSMWNAEVASIGSDTTADESGGMMGFLRASNDRGVSWLLIEGEDVIETHGREEKIEWLGARAGGFLDGYYSSKDIFEAGVPRIMAFGGGSGDALIYFEADAQAGFMTLKPEDMTTIFAHWNKAMS